MLLDPGQLSKRMLKALNEMDLMKILECANNTNKEIDVFVRNTATVDDLILLGKSMIKI